MRSLLVDRSFFFALLVVFVVTSVYASDNSDDPDILVPDSTLYGSVELDRMHCYDIPFQRPSEDISYWGRDKAYRIQITVRRDSPVSEFQVFTSFNRKPTKTNYDYANLEYGPIQRIIIEGFHTFDIEAVVTTCVYGKTSGSFSISAQLDVISKHSWESPFCVAAANLALLSSTDGSHQHFGRCGRWPLGLLPIQSDRHSS